MPGWPGARVRPGTRRTRPTRLLQAETGPQLRTRTSTHTIHTHTHTMRNYLDGQATASLSHTHTYRQRQQTGEQTRNTERQMKQRACSRHTHTHIYKTRMHTNTRACVHVGRLTGQAGQRRARTVKFVDDRNFCEVSEKMCLQPLIGPFATPLVIHRQHTRFGCLLVRCIDHLAAAGRAAENTRAVMECRLRHDAFPWTAARTQV